MAICASSPLHIIAYRTNMNNFLKRRWWFVFLLIVAGYVFLANVIKKARVERESVFSVENTSQITSIKIKAKGESKSIRLEKLNGHWQIDSNHRANDKAVQALFRVISRIKTSSPVPISVNDSLVVEINKKGVAIDLFDGNKIVKSYKLISTSTMNLKNIGLLNGSKNAYRLELPSFDGSIADLFIPDRSYWISNQLSVPDVSSISAIEVEIPNNIDQSFRIDIVDDGNYRLFSVYQGSMAVRFDTTKVVSFIQGFVGIKFSEIDSKTSGDQEHQIITSTPDIIYTFFKDDGSKYQIKTFPIPVDEYIDDLGRMVNYDLNRLYVYQSNDTSLYIVNYLDFYHLIRNISFFDPNFKN